MRPQSLVIAVAVLLTILIPIGDEFAGNAAEHNLRTLFFQRDYETGAIEGAKLVAAAAEDLQLKAWYILNLARADRSNEAIDAAKQMIEKAPKNGWSWIAQAGALHYQGGRTAEAIDAAAKAFELMPDDPDAIWLRAQTLAGDPKRREEAIAFVDAQRSRVKNPAEILATKAYALYVLSSATTPRDEVKLKAALDTFAEARQIDPSNVNALFLPGTYLDGLRRSDESYPLLKKAVSLAPGSNGVHQAYWRSIQGSSSLTGEQKNAEILADLTAFLEKHGNRPAALLTASYAARDLKLEDRLREVEERILREFNDSREAEWVLIERMRAFSTPESIEKPEYLQMLRAYVARPRHYHEGLLGETYRSLFFRLVKDRSVPAEELLRAANGMVRYETTNTHITHVAAPIALADQKILLHDAERIAREGIDALKKRVERQRPAYRSDKEFAEAVQRAPGIGHDALGWVLFALGRVDEAETELLKAYQIGGPMLENLYHLGRFYEGKNDIVRAEEYYIRGVAVQSPRVNPSQAALRTLYEKRHASADGYDKYLEDLRERDRMTRKDRILAARISKPEPAVAFNLRSLDGKRVTLDSLKGKVVIINFWGIWCGWCVQELPDLQKLHEKYAGDASVAILTIDNDQNPDDVPPWMKKRGFTFPVLVDDGYVAKVGVRAFPTTWFLDGQGRKVFEKVGWSEKLLEEFSWRIEAIRGRSPESIVSGK